jgi:cysteine-rich repeat protein
MTHKHTQSNKKVRFVAALALLVFSCALLQKEAAMYESDMSARLIPAGRSSVASSFSAGSRSSRRRTVRIKSVRILHGAPSVSPRRHGTGSLTIVPRERVEPVAIKAGCGDGLVTGVETCDDKNILPGDGCSVTCTIETGFQCASAQPSLCWSVCGDGVLAANEKCDDGNLIDADGCTAKCKVEFGFKCTGSPSSCIIPSYCGDGVVTGSEACDDGNSHSGDGCYNCKLE